jgi:hypothetical protein
VKMTDAPTPHAPGTAHRGQSGLWARAVHRPLEPLRSLGSVAAWAGAVLIVLSALVHLHLWSTGYRHIPTIGPLFLLQGVAGIVIAVALAILRHPLTLLLGAGYALATVAGLLISVNFGLFGFQDSIDAPYAQLSLGIEIAAAVILLAGIVAMVRRQHRAAA